MALSTYVLTVDLVNFQAADVEGIAVGVAMAEPRLIFPIKENNSDTSPETLYPTTLSAVTDGTGQANFRLMPSAGTSDQSAVGNYIITIGSFTRTITMPASNAILSALGDAVDAGEIGTTVMDVRMLSLASDLSDAEAQTIHNKLKISAVEGGGTSIQYGTAFPATAESGELFLFSDDVASGLTWKDVDTSTNITAAEVGDVARYDGTNWVKVGNWRSVDLPVATTAVQGIVELATNTEIDTETGTGAKVPTISGLFRGIARKVKNASTTVRGIVQIARNEDVDSTETDTDRVLDVTKGKRLISRIATDVEANPAGTTDGGDLTKIDIDGTIYSVPATDGSSGGSPKTLHNDTAAVDHDRDNWRVVTLSSAPDEGSGLSIKMFSNSGPSIAALADFNAKEWLDLPVIDETGTDVTLEGTDQVLSFVIPKPPDSILDAIVTDRMAVCRYSDTSMGVMFTGTDDLELRITEYPAGGGAAQSAGASSFSELTGHIAAAQINDASVPGGKLTSNSVTATQIAANAVGNSELATSAVQNTNIAVGTITGNRIASGAITSTKLGAGSVNTSALGTSAVTDVKLANNAVVTSRISNLAVTSAKLATAVQNLINGALQKSGGTMTGKITLDGAPTANLHAASKKYVDDNAGTDSTARAAATAAQSTADAALPKAGGTMTGKITLDGVPTADLHAATKKYVDDNAGSGDGGGGGAIEVTPAGDALTLTSNTQSDVTTGAVEGPEMDDLSDLLFFSFSYDRLPSDTDNLFNSFYRKADIGADSANPRYLQTQGAGEADIAIYANDGKITFGPLSSSAYASGGTVTVYNTTGGKQGAFYLRLYLAAATMPDKPTAGTYNVDADTFSVTPNVWKIQASTVPAGQRLWAIEAPIDPANDSGVVVDLTDADRWGAVFPVTGEVGPAGSSTDATARASAAAAQAAADAAQSTADAALPKAGGTMTGKITLDGAPTANLHASTKKYVDDKTGTNLPKAGGTMTGKITLDGAPTANLHAATKKYVDDNAGSGGTTVEANPDGAAAGGDLTKIDIAGTIYDIPAGGGGGSGGSLPFATEIGRGNVDIEVVRQWYDTGIDIPDSVGDDEWWGVQVLGESNDPAHLFPASMVVGQTNVTVGALAAAGVSPFHNLSGFIFEAFSGSSDHSTRLGRTAEGDIVIASASTSLDPMPLVLWRINVGGGTAIEANPSEAADGGDLTKIEIDGTVYDIAAGGSGDGAEPTEVYDSGSFVTLTADTWIEATFSEAFTDTDQLIFVLQRRHGVSPLQGVAEALVDAPWKLIAESDSTSHATNADQVSTQFVIENLGALPSDAETGIAIRKRTDGSLGYLAKDSLPTSRVRIYKAPLGGGDGGEAYDDTALHDAIDALDVPEVVGDFVDADADNLAAGYGVYPSEDGTFSDSDFVLSGTTPAAGTNRFFIRTPKHASRYGARIVLNTTPPQVLPDNDPLSQEHLVKVASRPDDAQDGYDYFFIGFIHDDAPIQDANANTFKLQVAPVTRQEIINIGYWQDGNRTPNVAPTTKSIATVRAGELFPIVFPARARPRNLHFALAARYEITALYIAGSSALTDFSKVAESRLANFWHSSRIQSTGEVSCLIRIEET